MERYLLGLDAGTTSFKAALFDENRRMIWSGQRDYVLLTSGEDVVEFPAEEYWRILCGLSQSAIRESGIDAGKVAALAISSQGETLISLDEQGNALGNAIVWLDNRAVAQADALRERFGLKRVYEVTGQSDMLATWPAAKLLWLRENCPEQFEKTNRFLLLEDYLLYRLTGRFAGEQNLWASSAMLNIHTGAWWAEMLEAISLTQDRLPKIQPCGSALGKLQPEAARAMGLTPDTMAVMGALDQSCNAIGCGITLPGMICETTGSCLAVSAVVDEFIPYNADAPITCQNFVVPGRYVVLLWSQTAGMALKWFAQKFYGEYEDLNAAFAKINADVAQIPMGCDGLTALPHLNGASNPEYDPYARGVFCGVTLEHGRAHFARAVMEAVACMLRRNLEQLEAAGVEFDSVFSMGGGAKSPMWLGIKSAITGKKVRPLMAGESACLGAAILAGVGIGVFESVDWKPEALSESAVICADKGIKEDGLYRRYIRLYETLKPLFLENAQQRKNDAEEGGL